KTMFDGFEPATYADEARDRWGQADAYKESARRTKGYGKPEWEAIKREAEAIYRRFAELMHEGTPPSDARVRGVVEAHRAHIDRWFYPCSIELQQALAAMYVTDPRFRANIDKYALPFGSAASPGQARLGDNSAAGLAEFIHAAVCGDGPQRSG
ncbi:MAG: TipAS antibiotic-recognition domain-containing protein, partial [Kofleriaceae bacterium]